MGKPRTRCFASVQGKLCTCCALVFVCVWFSVITARHRRRAGPAGGGGAPPAVGAPRPGGCPPPPLGGGGFLLFFFFFFFPPPKGPLRPLGGQADPFVLVPL